MKIKTPTDAEILELASQYWHCLDETESATEIELVRAALAKWGQPAQASKCTCTLAQRCTGSGCRYCNPQEYIDMLHDQIAENEPAQAADSVQEDAARLDWLDQQCEGYGFQDIHEGNRWEISGPYANVRQAIDYERAARKQGEKQ